jgi:uncharacterized protein involved in exopolysaccharide biosynthesis
MRRKQLNNITFELERLKREFNNKQENLNMLRANLEEARILKANDIELKTIKIIDRAHPPGSPEKKKKIILLLVGIVSSFCFSIGIAFISEYLDESIKTVEDAKELLDVPILGTVPKATKKVK